MTYICVVYSSRVDDIGRALLDPRGLSYGFYRRRKARLSMRLYAGAESSTAYRSAAMACSRAETARAVEASCCRREARTPNIASGTEKRNRHQMPGQQAYYARLPY